LLPRRGRKVQAVGLALALVLLGLLAVAAYFERDRIRRILGLRPEPTVAVLPFEDMSEKHDQGYFADGVTEEIISALAQVEGLKVAGWTSSSSFKGKRIGLDEVGRALQVAHVLEGSVRRSGDRFRIKTELHSTSTGFQIWSRTFESISADIFAVQDEIANRVVEALQVKLVPDRVPRTKSLETRNQEAHEEYLKGRASFRSGSLEGYRLALAHYQEATELDAGYAPAWAGISEVLLRLESWTEVHDPGMRARARDASERAVSLGPRLSDAYRARSMVRAAFLLDWAGALSDAGRALELSPGDPASETYHARALANVGRLTEATAAAAKATQLDPRDPGAWILLGSMYHYGGDTERALGALDRALELAPDNVAANYEMAATLLAAGRANAVLPMAGWMQQVSHARFFTALAQQELGNHEASQRALDELIARNAATDAYQIAAVYAARRENDRAFEWLDRAFDQRDPGLWSTLTDPLLNDLHQDPRWQPFLRRLNLPTGGVSGN
jgi:TolB-like protein/thioredoxin-like negative regulator of GroEL